MNNTLTSDNLQFKIDKKGGGLKEPENEETGLNQLVNGVYEECVPCLPKQFHC